MKYCPICQKQYPDTDLNFCFNDGGTLVNSQEDPPPTIMMPQVRETQSDWASQYQPPSNQNQQMVPPQIGGIQAPYYPPARDQTLAIVSLVMGILSVLFICCYGGFPFGLAALATGYLGYKNASNKPNEFAGTGMAIAGMIIGGMMFVLSFIFIFIGIFASIFSK